MRTGTATPFLITIVTLAIGCVAECLANGGWRILLHGFSQVVLGACAQS
jgi:hypothetical protein